MTRQPIPAFDLSVYGREELRAEGIVVQSLDDSFARDPQRLRPHYHDFFQIMLLTGRGSVMHDFRDYDVAGRTLFFLSPGQVHELHPQPELEGTVVSFTKSFFDHASPPPSALLEFPFFFPAECSPLFAVDEGDTFRIVDVFANLQWEFDAALAGAAEALRAALRILFVRVNRRHAEVKPVASPSRAARLVREFQLAVERSFREDRPLVDYARELEITPNHLSDLVRAETGQSAGSIVRARRLLDAKRLLSHSDLSVSEIGYQLGFGDPSYFARFFRRETKLAPAEFRREIREKYRSNGT